MEKKKIYAVSMVFNKKVSSNTEDTSNNVRIVIATSEEEAFGLAYDAVSKKYETYKLFTKLVVPIPDSIYTLK